MKRLLFIISAAFAALSLQAQPVYTLEQCVSMAKANNIKMRNAENDVKMASQTRKEAFTKYFPTISATGTFYNADKGLLELDVMPGMVPSMSLLKNGLLGGITVTQPIFAGGQIVNGNKLAKVGVDVSRLKAEMSENEVELTTEQYFWQVVVLQEKLKTVAQLEKQLSKIEHDVEAAVNAGVTQRNDLLQVRLKHNDISSTRVNLENGIALSRRLLAHQIGAEEESVNVSCDIDTKAVPTIDDGLLVDHKTALASTTSYRLLEKNVRASKLQQRMAVGKNLPTVAVGAGYLYDDLMDKDHSFTIGFVTASVPLSGWWGGAHNIKKHKLATRNAENLLQDNSELLVIAMQKAWDDLQNAYKQALLAHNSIEQSAENLRLNQDYYAAGTSTMTDLLNAQTLYQQSCDKYVEAYSQLRLKTTEYLHATGR